MLALSPDESMVQWCEVYMRVQREGLKSERTLYGICVQAC